MASPAERTTQGDGPQRRDRSGDGGPSRASVFGVFRLRDFRLLVAGEGVSLLGDQFALIALPWLVLELTGNALVLGAVLAIQGIPRALFMLVGGAVTDRFSPRGVMLAANAARCVVVAALAAVVLTGVVETWMLYVYALAFGLADGFFFPAQNAIVPQIAGDERLETANAVVQGLEQVALFVAPVLAGVLIAGLSHAGSAAAGGSGSSGSADGLTGVGLALAIDAATFVVSLGTLALIGVRRYAPDEAGADGGLLAAIGAGLRYLWSDATLRLLFVIIVAVNFLVIGPMLVGIPVLAARRLSQGAEGYGIVMSTFGGASLLGIVAGGLLPRPPARL
ncbi:MAG TPA: MFS transporter, partial [Thermoleophilia bacterium]|nr:MFS transporter [Thermoleophilia bacterium]